MVCFYFYSGWWSCFFPFLVPFFLKYTHRETGWDPEHSSEADRAWLCRKRRVLLHSRSASSWRNPTGCGEQVTSLGWGLVWCSMQNDFLLLWLLRSLDKAGSLIAHSTLHYLRSTLLQETGSLGARDGVLYEAIHGARPRSWQMGKWHQYSRHFIYSGQINDEVPPLSLKGSTQNAAYNHLKWFFKTALVRNYYLTVKKRKQRVREKATNFLEAGWDWNLG